ncbi:hypothetical protein M184_gp42 [Mycobacterium phage WIVsmall]|uniref:hypothetical protein n=1 Tax=Mycobacterium phage WIVsmall TaxID=1327036 RepID=UPI00032B5795|nr:hypothetical protein M184_gp42 [Mycobacterium phage WIVsmall]AGK88181.1 hypothetical protein WIVsmall_42 [Mycobacterium phage WIVsmall]
MLGLQRRHLAPPQTGRHHELNHQLPVRGDGVAEPVELGVGEHADIVVVLSVPAGQTPARRRVGGQVPGDGGVQRPRQEPVLVTKSLRGVPVAVAAAGGFHDLHPSRDVLLGQFGEGDVAEVGGDVVGKVLLVLVDGVLLDAGEVVDVVADPLSHGQLRLGASGCGVDAVHLQGACSTVGVHRSGESVGGFAVVEGEGALCAASAAEPVRDQVGGGSVSAEPFTD